MSGADRELVRRLGKFPVVGASGVAVNKAALFTFYQLLRLPLVVAWTATVVLWIVIAAGAGAASNDVVNARWRHRPGDAA